jgi:Tol biopolymer transport system component/DNA-binding winged helix-turn-helix (wHTH) protein
MTEMGEPPRVCRFGAYEFETRTGELRKHGGRLKLQEQPRLVLMLLLEQPGETVTRDQIQKRLWPEGTFVDFDNAINSAVRKLREVLNDTAENPRFIETVARRGYRFVAPVATTEVEAVPAPKLAMGSALPVSPAATSPVVQAGPHRKWQWLAITAVLALAAVLLSIQRHTTSATGIVNLQVVPLTSNPGLELHPSFSADGSRIAYSWNGMNGGPFAIYTKLIGAGDPVRITHDLARDFSPAWSPDGRWVAALRDLGQQSAVILIPSSGGQARELTRVTKGREQTSCIEGGGPHMCGFIYWGSLLSWSPDGRYLFTSAYTGPDSPHAIVRISSDTGAQTVITSPLPGTGGDYGAILSPDGRSLAFVRMVGAKTADVYVLPLSSATLAEGSARRVTTDGADIESLAWIGDGRELVFSSTRSGRRELWSVDAAGSAQPRRIAGVGENGMDLAISRDGKRLAYTRGVYIGSLWKVPIAEGKAGKPVRVTASTARDKFSHISADGKRIAFQSARSGVDEIWLCDADGENLFQLTNFGKGMSGSPRWSPDGRSVAFDSNVEGNWDIWVIDVAGGKPRRVTTHALSDAIPNWSRDGRWIYFSSTRTGRAEIWKIHPDGSSEIQVTRAGGAIAVESVDGKTLYFKTRGDQSDLWKMPVDGGPAILILHAVTGRIFTVTSRGIYYAAAEPSIQLQFLDFEKGSSQSIGRLSPFAHADVSPDERWVLSPVPASPDSNIMLVENYR